MNSENDSQVANSEQGQSAAQDKSPETNNDYKVLYLKEIENSKQQRTGKQSAITEVDKLQAKVNQFEEDKMVADGKQTELIDKLKAENKDLSAKAIQFDSYKESEKKSILEQFPEEDREELATKSLDTLKYIQKKTLNKPEGNHIPNIPSMVKNSTPDKPYAQMNEQERKAYHTSVLQNKI